MKKLTQTLVVFVFILALVSIFTGCSSDGGSESKNPVTGLEIKDGDGTVISEGATILLKTGTSTTLTAEVTGGGEATVSWISDDTNIVSVNPATGTTVQVQAGNTAGTAEITVTAGNADGGVTQKINVTVSATVAVTGVSVKAGEVDVGDTLNLTMGTPLELTAMPAPAGLQGVSYAWTADPEGIVEFSDTDTAVTTISAVSGKEDETTAITITAWNDDNTEANKATKTFTVTVQPSGYIEPPVTGFTLKIGDTTIDDLDEYDLDVGDTGVNATVTLEPQGVNAVVNWTSSSPAVTLASTGTTNTITAVSGAGQSVITVSASNTSTETPVTLTFTVFTVKHRGNLPWEWAIDTSQEWPETGLTNGNNNTYHTKAGDNVTVRAYGGTISLDGGKTGIRLGASGNTGPARLVIGQAGNAATTNGDTASTIKGDFDLSQGTVKVTVAYKDLEEAAGRYVFRVYVNNNGTGAAASFFGNASQIASYYGKTDATGDKIPDSPIEVLIDPSIFTEAQKAALADAFICFHAQQSNQADSDNGLTITSIKIEQVSSAGITINPEADFDGFPDAEFLLSGSQTITLSGNYETVEWYINGEKQSQIGKSFTLSDSDLIKGEHTLSVVVKVQGKLYSKSIKFTVGN
jgi:hypothetical protein